jgi:glutathione S-transferase
MKLYYAPRTRSVRVAWLLDELGLPYERIDRSFDPPAETFFRQDTPTGKFPTLVDGDVTLCESGAILEYVLERYGEGRMAPPIGTPERARYLQWLHYAEGTAFPPIGIVIWLSRYRGERAAEAALLDDARSRAAGAFVYLEQGFGDGPWLCGELFTAADVMMGFTLIAAQAVGVLDARFPKLQTYVGRLLDRPALQKLAAEQ